MGNVFDPIQVTCFHVLLFIIFHITDCETPYFLPNEL